MKRKNEGKQSETKRKLIFLVSQNKAKRKQNGFCFASFRFEAKKKYKRKWDTLGGTHRPPPLCVYLPSAKTFFIAAILLWEDVGIVLFSSVIYNSVDSSLGWWKGPFKRELFCFFNNSIKDNSNQKVKKKKFSEIFRHEYKLGIFHEYVCRVQNYKWHNRKEYKGKTNWTFWEKGEGFALHCISTTVVLFRSVIYNSVVPSYLKNLFF